MNKKSLLALMLVFMLAFSTFGVYADQHMDEESNTIVDIAVADENFSTLVAALTEAELVETLQGEGPFTVFAPTDAAFADLLAALEIEAADLLAHPQLADVLLYHVVAGAVMSTDLEEGMEAETVGGESLTFSLEDGVFVNESEVVQADIEADNGVIHVIDSVLVPESFVLEVEEEEEIIEEEEEVIEAPVSRTIILEVDNPQAMVDGQAMMLDVAPYIGEGDRTLVPLRFVSEALGYEVQWDGDARTVTIMDGDEIAVLLTIDSRSAMVYGAATELEVPPVIHAPSARTVVPLRFVSETLGYDVEWHDDTRTIVITMDKEEEEEVVSNTIVDIALAGENFSILVAALQAADLVETLQGEGPFTVFAPTDEAFEALLEALEIEAADLLAHPQLADVLLYHVVAGAVMSTDLEDGMEAETVGGESVTISLEDGVFVNEAEVVTADIEADNGVIHVIDSVLVPESFVLEVEEEEEEEVVTTTIVDIAVGDENFSTLVAALQAADLVETLQGEGPFTVFAPTDEAFEALLEALEIEAADLLAHPQLADVLLYHVVSGAVMSGDLVDGSEVATVGGETIKVDLEDGVFVNESEVVAPDIEADNGVIHVINAVLVPESFEL